MATDFGFIPIKSSRFFFISYNTEDSSRVAPIVKYMNECGVPFWYDYGLEYGKEWETQIAAHIADCESVLMFVTKGLFYKEKSYVRKEYDEAVIYGKTIIPIFLDDINPSALPRHSVGFYVDLNRLHNVSYAKNNSVQTIAQKAAHALGVKLSESVVTTTEDKQAPNLPPNFIEEKNKSTSKRYSSSILAFLKKYKNPLIVVLCTVIVILVCVSLIMPQYEIDNGEATATGNTSIASKLIYYIIPKLTIPSEIYGVEVTGIGEHAFRDCDGLTEVVISDNITTISRSAFYSCSNLTKVTIPNSVTSIGYCAFADCEALTEITIPDSVTSIDERAFAYCTRLERVELPDSVTSIGAHAFDSCSNLTEITIPDSVISIGEDVFYGCTIIVHAPHKASYYDYEPDDGVTWVVESNGNTADVTEVVPDGLYYRSVNNEAEIINYAGNATNLIIPAEINGAKVTSIGDGAFGYCYNLTKIIIPDSVTNIGDYAFNGCSSLTEITIPDGVTSIGSETFWGCTITVYAPHEPEYYGYEPDEDVTWVVK